MLEIPLEWATYGLILTIGFLIGRWSKKKFK